MQRENIDLYTLAEKAIQSLAPRANTLCAALEISGLGLSIVKHAAKIHNVRVEVKSHVGKSTAVIVIFPT